MTVRPQNSLLPGGRLHLHHGPIDLIIGVAAGDRDACYRAACARFETVLHGLAEELPMLRAPMKTHQFNDPIARRMARAVSPHSSVFVTPMAAVAGAVADEVLAAMTAEQSPSKAYVNNGGDIAFHLGDRQTFTALGPTGDIHIRTKDTARGIATSGWRGRSHSRGIADAVTVLAKTAAAADVAATLIANAVDLPNHAAVSRMPANMLNPESDLGARLVTTHVGNLPADDIATALASGAKAAQAMIDQGHILQAILSLQGHSQAITPQGTLTHA